MDAEDRWELGLQEQVAELVAQQAVISEVLRAIANSPHELQPIFDTIVANAMRLCRSELGGLGFFEGNGYRIVSLRGPPERYYDGSDEGRVFPYSQTVRSPRSSKQNRLSTSPTLRPMRLISSAIPIPLLGPKEALARTC
jgi:hypothetical protein